MLQNFQQMLTMTSFILHYSHSNWYFQLYIAGSEIDIFFITGIYSTVSQLPTLYNFFVKSHLHGDWVIHVHAFNKSLLIISIPCFTISKFMYGMCVIFWCLIYSRYYIFFFVRKGWDDNIMWFCNYKMIYRKCFIIFKIIIFKMIQVYEVLFKYCVIIIIYK